MSKKCRIVLFTAVLIALALVLAGCGKNYETPWEWIENLKSDDIESAVIWYVPEADDKNDAKSTEEQQISLSDKEIDKLFIILYRLGESNFTENADNAGSTPQYGLKITMTDGKEYNINQSIAPQGALEMQYADKQWFLSSDKLDTFIKAFLEDIDLAEESEDKDKDFATEGNLDPIDRPQYASDGSLIVQEEIDYSTYSNIS